MRTTIELKPEHRSALMALASRRGEKGFSSVLGEAIEVFLQGEVERENRVGRMGPILDFARNALCSNAAVPCWFPI